jgi:hypothetical protein
MEGFSFVTPITGLSRHNTGNEDDDDDSCVTCSVCIGAKCFLTNFVQKNETHRKKPCIEK